MNKKLISPDHLIKKIKEELSLDFPHEVSNIYKTEMTFGFKLVINNSDKFTYFVKTKNKRSKFSTDPDNQLEYNIISNLWNNYKYSSEDEYCIPEPVLYLDEEDYLVLKNISGQKLSSKLSKFYYFPLNYFLDYNIFKKIGAWLVDYEEKVYEGKTILLKDVINNITLEKLNQNRFISDNEKILFNRTLMTNNSFDIELPTHLVCNDFRIHNLIIDSNKLTKIDWEKTNYSGLCFWMPLSLIYSLRGSFFSNSFLKTGLQRSISVFLTSYFQNTIFKDKKIFLPQIEILFLIAELSNHPKNLTMNKYVSYQINRLKNLFVNFY